MYIRKLIQVRVTGYQNVFFLTDITWYLLKFRNVIHGLSLAVYFMRICQAWGSFGVLYLALRSTALEFLVCYA